MAPFLFFNAGSVQLTVITFELQNGASNIIAVISLGGPGTVEVKVSTINERLLLWEILALWR